jgi:hypothetical protein
MPRNVLLTLRAGFFLPMSSVPLLPPLHGAQHWHLHVAVLGGMLPQQAPP